MLNTVIELELVDKLEMKGKKREKIEWFLGFQLGCILVILNKISNMEDKLAEEEYEKFNLGYVTSGVI